MIKNSFEVGPEGWCSYDYHWSVVGGSNVFILATWEESGGVNGAGYVWSDGTRWSADTPESPVSVLPFLLYRSWVGLDPVDLRGAEVSVYLRGDGLQLGGAQCYFWVHSQGCRWHMGGRPLTVTEGSWNSEPNILKLETDESSWYRSWSMDPDHELPLDEVLRSVHSYGFSFVRFGQEPRGRISMDEFEIKVAGGG